MSKQTSVESAPSPSEVESEPAAPLPPMPVAVKIRSLQQLSALVNAPRSVVTRLVDADENSEVEFLIRPISQEEATVLDRLRDVEPPRKPPTPEQLKAREPGDFNWEDKGFVRRAAEAQEEHTAAVIMAGTVPPCELVPPGTPPAEAARLLARSLPPRVINFLLREIMALSSTEMRLADFFTKGR